MNRLTHSLPIVLMLLLGGMSLWLKQAIEGPVSGTHPELRHEPDAMVGFERRITLQNVGDPDPPRWQQVVLGTHPPTMERIGQALASASGP